VGTSVFTLPLRMSLRAARAALRTTRNAADVGLSVVELIGDVLEPGGALDGALDPDERVPYTPAPERSATTTFNGDGPVSATPAPEPEVEPVAESEPVAPHVDAEAEVVEEVADPGAQDGAGAQIRVDPPFDGYDKLRAADVVARLRGADVATLGAIELYERSHRRRRTVLDAVTRELKRPRGI
jgi:hypothetical protein